MCVYVRLGDLFVQQKLTEYCKSTKIEKIKNLKKNLKKKKRKKVYSGTGLTKEIKKSQINNLTYHFKVLEKEQTKPKVCRRKRIKRSEKKKK